MVTLMSTSSQWLLGIGVGVVVIAVAAAIVVTIVMLAMRIDRQAKTSEEAVRLVRDQTSELDNIGQINDSGVQDPAFGSGASQSGGRQMIVLALSSHAYWEIALGIGLVAALIVAFLLAILIQTVRGIQKSVDGLLVAATEVAGNTANIPQLEATAPVLGLIITEAVVQDGYMNALTDGYGGA